MLLPDSWKAFLNPVVAVAVLALGVAGASDHDGPLPPIPTPPDDRNSYPFPGAKEIRVQAFPRIATSEDDRGFARSLAITARTSKAEYRQLEPIVVEIEIKNVHPEGRAVKVLGHGFWHRTVRAYWRTADGIDRGPAQPTNFIKCNMHLPVGGGASGSHLKPSAALSDKLVANLVNDMTAPGEYTIVVEVEMGYYDEAKKWTPAVAHSNAVKVRVTGGGPTFRAHDHGGPAKVSAQRRCPEPISGILGPLGTRDDHFAPPKAGESLTPWTSPTPE